MSSSDKRTTILALDFAILWEQSYLDSLRACRPIEGKASRENIQRFEALRQKLLKQEKP